MKIRVVSYNIHRAIGLDRRFRPDRIERVLAHHDAHFHDHHCGCNREWHHGRWVYYYGDHWEYYDPDTGRWYYYDD